jgi:hypothetical protein
MDIRFEGAWGARVPFGTGEILLPFCYHNQIKQDEKRETMLKTPVPT